MSVSAFDSPLYRDLFGDPDSARLMSDSATMRAMLLVMGTLAKVQGDAGVIPELSGAFLHRAALEVQIDPGALTASTGENGVSVPALVWAFRKALDAPEHGQYLHWGATSQDVQDTATILRMRQVVALIEGNLKQALAGLADLAERHADTPQAARTYGQIAVPSSFGAMVATWGWPLLRQLRAIDGLRRDALVVSLSGAAGTGSMLGPDPAGLRRALARALDLGDPGMSWHATRGPIRDLGHWFSAVAEASGKMAEDLLRLTRSGAAEVRLGGAGASSTMPQKQNPVGPSALAALARTAPALLIPMAAPHGEARDGAAWFTEWLCLPPLAATAARSAALSADLAGKIEPDTDTMAAQLNDPQGLIHAEALSFALAATMARPEAQAAVKTMATRVRSGGGNLTELLAAAHPDADLSGVAGTGSAPADARAFAQAARGAI